VPAASPVWQFRRFGGLAVSAVWQFPLFGIFGSIAGSAVPQCRLFRGSAFRRFGSFRQCRRFGSFGSFGCSAVPPTPAGSAAWFIRDRRDPLLTLLSNVSSGTNQLNPTHFGYRLLVSGLDVPATP
jgi:hypothetical protein